MATGLGWFKCRKKAINAEGRLILNVSGTMLVGWGQKQNQMGKAGWMPAFIFPCLRTSQRCRHISSTELSLPCLSLFRVFSKAKSQSKHVLPQVASSGRPITAKRVRNDTPFHGFCPPNHVCGNLKANVAGGMYALRSQKPAGKGSRVQTAITQDLGCLP